MSAATVRQCAILVGGLGTRLGPLTAATPKPLLPVGDRPFLAWLVRELVRFGVRDVLLLTGHLSADVDAAIPAIRETLPLDVTIGVSREPLRAGTGGALFHARDRLDDRFLLCNGDSVLDGAVPALLSAAVTAEPDTQWMALRPLGDASRYGVVALDGDRVTSFQERPAPGQHGIINGGVYLFTRTILDALGPVCSLESDILPNLARKGTLRGARTEGFFLDIGVPEDYSRGQTEIPAMASRPALFLDRDGVINLDHGYVGSRDRFEFVAGAREAVAYATNAGWHVFIVTNQSGVARGYYGEPAVAELLAWIADECRSVGGTIDDSRYCPFHPDATIDDYRAAHAWRKPAPGMLLDLIRAWNLDPARALLIGDQATDLQAASAAGVSGYLFTGGNLLDFVRPLLEARRR